MRTNCRPFAWVARVALLVLACAGGGHVAGAATVAQSKASVSARLSQGIIKLGAQVHLEIEVEGTEQAVLESLPEVNGLTIGPAGRPNRQFYQSWVNGRYQSSTRVTWVVPVRPFGTGEFEIPPATLRVDGNRRVETRRLTLTVVEDLRGAELGLFEIQPSSTFVVEGQPFSIELRFGFDSALDRSINYANLSLPWWGALSGAVPVETTFVPPEDARTEILINGDHRVNVQVERTEERGRSFVLFRYRQGYVATRTGTLDLSGNIFEFGRVVDSGGFLTSRRKKVESYYVRSPELEVEVVPLPEEGRPFDFGGAIGSLDVRAETDTRDVTAGDSIKLTVEWHGAGNFEFFDVPDPSRDDAFNGFRVYGSTEESKGFDHRRVVYDLAPLSAEVDRIPPVELPYYDPQEGSYASVATSEIPIRVRPLESAIQLGDDGHDDRFAPDLTDIHSSLPAARGSLVRPGTRAVAALWVGVPCLWLVGRTAFRRRRGDPDAPLERRRRKARRELARRLRRAHDAREELEALQAFLAARTKEADQAWVGRGLDPSAEPALEEDTAREFNELVGDLEAAAYGQRASSRNRRDVLRVADRLIAGGL